MQMEEESGSERENESLTPSNSIESEELSSFSSLTDKTKKLYMRSYESFIDWKTENKINDNSESVLLKYFTELSSKYKPTSLYSHHSKLKSTLNEFDGINIEKYRKVQSLLKQKSKGFHCKQASIFSSKNIKDFLANASDDIHLPTKVALIMGVTGACRTTELYQMKLEDLKDLGTEYLVSVPNPKTKFLRKFIVTHEFYHICKKYVNCPTRPASENTLFLNYKKGKCLPLRIGINKFAQLGRDIAVFLNLKHPEKYSGHSFRKSSATLLIDGDGDITVLKPHGRWKSPAAGYIDESISYETNTDNNKTNSILVNASPNFSILEETKRTEKNSTEFEYVGITREQATKLVNTWVHQVMQLNPEQQSHTIDQINNILNQETSGTSFPKENFDIPDDETSEIQINLYQGDAEPEQSDDRNEYVSNSDWSIKVEPTDDLGLSDELVSDWTDNLEHDVDVEPTIITQEQPQIKIESVNGLGEVISSATLLSSSSDEFKLEISSTGESSQHLDHPNDMSKPLPSNDVTRKRSLSSSSSIPEDHSATETKVQKLESTTIKSTHNEAAGISEENAVALAKTWVDLLLQLLPDQQRHAITVINEVLNIGKSSTPILKSTASIF